MTSDAAAAPTVLTVTECISFWTDTNFQTIKVGMTFSHHERVE